MEDPSMSWEYPTYVTKLSAGPLILSLYQAFSRRALYKPTVQGQRMFCQTKLLEIFTWGISMETYKHGNVNMVSGFGNI